MNVFDLVLLAPAAASLAAIVWLACSGSRLALGATLLLSLGTLLFWGWLTWVLRDGFNIFAYSQTTSGLEAWNKFRANFWIETLVWGAFTLVALGVFRWRRRRAVAA